MYGQASFERSLISNAPSFLQSSSSYVQNTTDDTDYDDDSSEEDEKLSAFLQQPRRAYDGKDIVFLVPKQYPRKGQDTKSNENVNQGAGNADMKSTLLQSLEGLSLLDSANDKGGQQQDIDIRWGEGASDEENGDKHEENQLQGQSSCDRQKETGFDDTLWDEESISRDEDQHESLETSGEMMLAEKAAYDEDGLQIAWEEGIIDMLHDSTELTYQAGNDAYLEEIGKTQEADWLYEEQRPKLNGWQRSTEMTAQALYLEQVDQAVQEEARCWQWKEQHTIANYWQRTNTEMNDHASLEQVDKAQEETAQWQWKEQDANIPYTVVSDDHAREEAYPEQMEKSPVVAGRQQTEQQSELDRDDKQFTRAHWEDQAMSTNLQVDMTVNDQIKDNTVSTEIQAPEEAYHAAETMHSSAGSTEWTIEQQQGELVEPALPSAITAEQITPETNHQWKANFLVEDWKQFETMLVTPAPLARKVTDNNSLESSDIVGRKYTREQLLSLETHAYNPLGQKAGELVWNQILKPDALQDDSSQGPTTTTTTRKARRLILNDRTHRVIHRYDHLFPIDINLGHI